MGRKEYSEEVKAAVTAALLSGSSLHEIATRYKVPAGTIRSWKSRQDGAPVAIVATDKRTEIGELLVEFLRKSINTLSVQVEHFADKPWLEGQPAAESASLFGTIADRTFRILEALEAGAEREPPAGVLPEVPK